jgi:hypothetical protein
MGQIKVTFETFVQQLILHVPEFKPAYDEHVKNNPTPLLHVLTGDLTRFVIDIYRESKSGQPTEQQSRQLLSKCLSFLEESISSPDEKVQELLSVSFLENLDQADSDYDGIKALLGPRLRKELVRRGSF